MPLTEKWPQKLWNGKNKEPGESASMMEHVDVEAPQRPPPPPPLRLPDREAHLNPYEDSRFAHEPFYISSPEQVTSPPSFSDHVMAASPVTPPLPLYAPYSPKSPVRSALSRSLIRDSHETPPTFAPEKRYSDDTTLITEEETTGVRNDTTIATVSEEKQPEEEEESEDEDIPDQPPLIIITGATSGLGLALFQHFAAQEPASPEHHKYDVLGIDKSAWRLPGKGFQWQTNVGKSGKFVQLDITATLKRLDTWASNFLYTLLPSPPSHKTGEITMRRYPRPVSLLIHCASTGGGASTAAAAAAAAAESLDLVSAPTLRAAFDTTVIGTLQLMQTILPHLQLHADVVKARQDEVTAAFAGSTEWLDQLRAQGSRASLQTSRPLPPRDPPARAVVLGDRGGGGGDESSAVAGSGGGGGGGFYASRASRAALNAVVRTLSVDMPDICFARINMGRVEMNMVKGNGQDEGSGSCEQSLEDLVPLIEKLGDGHLASGCFVDRFGDPVSNW
ncbi:unnamed protein product [Discula destructiva]